MATADDARSSPPPPNGPHGSIAEEAARLADVAQQWLAQRSARSAGTGDVWSEATAGSEPTECRTCPLCRARRMVGDLNPEVLDNLSAAVASLVAAARAVGSPAAGAGTTRRT